MLIWTLFTFPLKLNNATIEMNFHTAQTFKSVLKTPKGYMLMNVLKIFPGYYLNK